MKAPLPRTGRIRVARDDPRRAGELRHGLADRAELVAAGERAHVHALLARIADFDLGKARGERLLDRVHMLRGAMARRMAVHFCPALTVISRATSLMKASNSGVPGAASGPRRGIERGRVGDEAHRSRAITG
jgi:hypothetical protein